jgi:hypothetical protein
LACFLEGNGAENLFETLNASTVQALLRLAGFFSLSSNRSHKSFTWERDWPFRILQGESKRSTTHVHEDVFCEPENGTS